MVVDVTWCHPNAVCNRSSDMSPVRCAMSQRLPAQVSQVSEATKRQASYMPQTWLWIYFGIGGNYPKPPPSNPHTRRTRREPRRVAAVAGGTGAAAVTDRRAAAQWRPPPPPRPRRPRRSRLAAPAAAACAVGSRPPPAAAARHHGSPAAVSIARVVIVRPRLHCEAGPDPDSDSHSCRYTQNPHPGRKTGGQVGSEVRLLKGQGGGADFHLNATPPRTP